MQWQAILMLILISLMTSPLLQTTTLNTWKSNRSLKFEICTSPIFSMLLFFVSCVMADEPCWWILYISPLWHPEVRHEVTLVWKVLLEHLPANQLHQADWESYITLQQPLISIHKCHFWTKVVTDLQPSKGSQLNNDYVYFDGIYKVKSNHINLSINKANYFFSNAGMFWFYH
jgi:hypothetical protein